MPIARDRERHSPRCAQHTSHLTCSHLLVSALRLPGILLLSLSLICQLVEENGPNDVLKQALQIPREQIMPLEEGERFSSQLSKLEFRKLQILGRR